MSYVALKPCTFAGHPVMAGEIVPSELIDSRAIPRLIQQQYIAEVKEDEQPTAMVECEEIIVPILAEEGVAEITVTQDELDILFKIIQSNATDAVTIVNEFIGPENGNLAVCLQAVESRKSVLKAVEEKFV